MNDHATIQYALDELPQLCPYHDEKIDPPKDSLIFRESCCYSGRPALRRRNAQAALDRLREKANSTTFQNH